MRDILPRMRGALLGLAVGDAMGYTVDSLSIQEIRQSYGPNGLLGYDLVNGYADVTSYTQLAAFTCNGLLLGLTRGQMTGKMLPLHRYVGLSSREWAASQRPWGRPSTSPDGSEPGDAPAGITAGSCGRPSFAAATAWTPGCWTP